ncbi:MAG: sodium:alanine symporter family protein [Parasporobacterium sp.]|nr:sodium:alanine symporter family protein [Parasporobacterium sp.]
MGILDWITNVNGSINGFVWGIPMLVLLIGTGIFMTILTKVFQVSHIGHWFKNTIGDIFTNKHVTKHTDKNDKSISQFQSLCTALAATIGTGNIVGVAAAIAIGGPGAIFWMWIVAFFGMMTNYSENILGIYFRRKNKNNEWSGGAMYYLQDGLGGYKGMKWVGKILAILFACFAVLASFGIGNASQINSIAANMDAAFGIPAWVVGLALLVIGGVIIVGGLKRVASVTEKIVPFMAIVYIIAAIVVICFNGANVGPAFVSIFKGAFGLKSAAGGMVGGGIVLALTYGMKRGVFSNEAGLGSSVMVHSNSNVIEPVRQGMWGIFEVFADTIIVCTLTALVVLTSGVIDLQTGQVAAAYAEASTSTLVGQAFGTLFGNAGPGFVAIALLFFAFSTVLGWSHYGTKSFEYLFGEKAAIGYKIVFVLFIFVGATMDLTLAWDISDTFNGLMAIPNLIGVLSLFPIVYKITKNYVDRKIRHKNVVPMISHFPDIQKMQEEALARGEE